MYYYYYYNTRVDLQKRFLYNITAGTLFVRATTDERRCPVLGHNCAYMGHTLCAHIRRTNYTPAASVRPLYCIITRRVRVPT